MDWKLQTSFIPKKSLVETRASVRSGVSIIFLFALLVFVGSIALAGGVFLYKNVLEKSIESKDKQLAIARDQFEPETLEQFKKLNNRIVAGKQLVDQHVAMSVVFEALERATLKSVRFTDFRLEVGGNDGLSVQMRGQANSYSSVALQSDEFSKTGFFKNVIFSDLTLDTSGRVTFSVNAGVVPRDVLYAEAPRSGAQTSPTVDVGAAPEVPQEAVQVPLTL